MNWKTVAVLGLLVLALGGFFYYDTYWLGPTREKTQQAKGRLWSVEPKDVMAVTIRRKQDTIRLKRVEGGWELHEPVKARGDRGVVDETVTNLATLRVDREIDPNPAKLGDFGLEPATAEITLEVQGRSEPLALSVGGKSPTGAWVYGREASKPAVVALSEILSRDVARPVADFRDKTVLAFERRKVSALDLQIEGDAITLEAEEAGKWQILKPSPYRADGDLISGFLEKLESAKVKEFIAESPGPLGRYGLERPATVTIWTGKDKERASKSLHVGRVDKEKKGVYVMRAGEAGVMLAGEELWTALPKTVAALRDKVVVAYAYDKVNRLELMHGRGSVTVERDGPGWKLTAPEALKAETGEVNGLLWKLRDLRASGFLAEGATDIPRYLGKPEVTVRIWEEGAKEPKTLLLASSRETRGGQPAAIAAVAGQGPVMLVDARALQDLARTPHDLRDRSMFPAFDAKDVKRARIVASGKTTEVERSGESDWKMVEPSKGRVKESAVTGLFLTLKALRWKDTVAQGGDLARFGLDKPEVEVTLLKGDGAEIGGLLIGRQEGSVTYVRSKASPAIYTVESRGLADIRKAPAEISG